VAHEVLDYARQDKAYFGKLVTATKYAARVIRLVPETKEFLPVLAADRGS
jgi:hypothetical protein